MAFAGPQVQSEAVLGGYAIYVSTEGPLRLAMGGNLVKSAHMAIVPPYTRHSLRTTRRVRAILIEAETVAPDRLERDRLRTGGSEARTWAERIEEGFRHCRGGIDGCDADAFDRLFFGERLERRKLDERVALAVERIRAAPDDSGSTIEAIAGSVALSPSRLRHLFCAQVGVPIRRFRAWKRLRNAMRLALHEPSMLRLAMAAGYADATHLCHAVRRFLGGQPSFVCELWRRGIAFDRPSGPDARAGLRHAPR